MGKTVEDRIRCLRIAETLIARAIGHGDTAGVGDGNERNVRNERYFISSSSDAESQNNDDDDDAGRHSEVPMEEQSSLRLFEHTVREGQVDERAQH